MMICCRSDLREIWSSVEILKNKGLKSDIKGGFIGINIIGGEMESGLIWKDEYSSGHDVIDSEHEKLFDIASQILAVDNPGTDSEEINKLVHELYDYMRYHFENEENFMHEMSFPDIERHKKKHREIINEIKKMQVLNEGFNVLEMNLIYIMKEWFLAHILEEDVKIKQTIDSYELKLYYRYCRPGLLK